MTRRAAGLAALAVAIAALVAVPSARRVTRQLEIAASCDAAAASDWATVLEQSRELVGPDADGRYAAQCRCWALIATKRGPECTALLEQLLASEEAASWVPEAALAKQVIRARRDRGELESAAELAARAVETHPDDLNLLRLQIALRSALEGESRVLSEIESGLGRDAASRRAGVVLAASYRRRGDAAAALRVLGGDAPREPELLTPWFEQKTGALADLARADALRAAFRDWERMGGDPVELRARYALRLSTSQLSARGVPMVEMLRASLRQREGLRDRELVRTLYERLIAHLMAERRVEEALATYDAAIAEVELPSLSREQLERQTSFESIEARPGESRSGTLVFRIPELPGSSGIHGTPETHAIPETHGRGGSLLLSPPAASPADTPFERHPLAGADTVEVERELSSWPLRWVLRDSQQRVRASGSVWPQTGRATTVDIALDQPPLDPAAVFAPPERAADGRRRVFALVLDCADWRLLGYLRARSELPFLEHMLSTGYRAVLESSPPLTAAAMESLVWPERGERVSFLGLLHRLGLEVGGLASVGSNPLDFLTPLLPETPNLFEVIGAGPHVAANMLFAHGAIDAGRHAEMVGPQGERRLARQAETFRLLRPDEQARFPALVSDSRVRSRVETIASEFDVAVEMANKGEVDFLFLRIESLDVLTHALYVDLVRTGQDDGQAALLAVYRYIDQRLAELRSALDADDVFVVMSDHGIKNPMEHDEMAIFVATGEGVPRGRAPGLPSLRGVSKVLAALLDVPTRWEDTGVAPWAVEAAEASERVAAVAAGDGVAERGKERPGWIPGEDLNLH